MRIESTKLNASGSLAVYSSEMADDPRVVDEYSRRLGAYVLKLGKARDMNQKVLGAKMGISPGMMNKLSRGHAEWVDKYLMSAAKVLGVEPGHLFSVGRGLSPEKQTETGKPSEVARILPPGLKRFYEGVHGDAVATRERRWLESIGAEPADLEKAEAYWFKLWRIFRDDEPKSI